MASDQQVALTRINTRGNTSLMNKTTRMIIPAFLQKLYEMVNEPANADLIRWSDAGDTFFVLDHERFAREVLGRWFKHQNFSSFVRQLNMYGFHKIPHLQQGVLKSESDTEYWNFEHPNFRRGQPDLLCLIQRKKQVAQSGEDGVNGEGHDTTNLTAAPAAANLSPGQILDIHSIVNGIAAIKRHQTTISAELNELKRSNQLLWQDSLAARARHQKHQDTINRILKFLAGVFGNSAGTSHTDDDVDHAPLRAVVPRASHRLMIEAGSSKNAKSKVGITEIDDEDMAATPSVSTDHSSLSSALYTIDTPGSLPSPSLSPAEIITPSPIEAQPIASTSQIPYNSNYAPSLNPRTLYTSSNQHKSTDQYSRSTHPHGETISPSALTPLIQSPPNADSDEAVQAAINHLMQSPAHMQRLLAALSSQTIPDPMPPPGSESQALSSSQLTSYEPPYDFSRVTLEHPHPNASTSYQSPNPNIPLISSPSPNPPPGEDHGLVTIDPPLVENAHKLETTWKAAEDIDKDVNALHTSISSLIETFGLDPNLMASPQTHDLDAVDAPNPGSGIDDLNNNDGLHSEAMPDFDFDAFLNEFSQNPDYGAPSTAFLDEVNSPIDGGPPSPIVQPESTSTESETQTATRGRKRKSDVADLGDIDIDKTPTKNNGVDLPSSGGKSKRKR